MTAEHRSPRENRNNPHRLPSSEQQANEAIPFTTTLVQKLVRKGRLRRDYFSQNRSFPLNHEQAKELGLILPPTDSSDISIKGLPDETPYIQYLPGGNFRIEKVVKTSEITGVQEKQEYFRAHGLPTETYVALHPLTEFPDPMSEVSYGEYFVGPKTVRMKRDLPPGISVDEWKARVQEQLHYLRTHSYKNYREHFDSQHLIRWPHITHADIDRLSDQIPTMDFVVVLRTQPVSESFVDLQKKSNLAATEIVLEKIFASVNNVRNGSATPEGGFDISNTEHIKSFFYDFIPVNMGEYLGKLHNLGVVHEWPHGQNWKLDASLIDLVSIRGIPFGDPTPTAKEKRNDIERSIEAIDMLFNLTTMGMHSQPRNYDSYIAKKLFMDETLRETVETERFFVLALPESRTLEKNILDQRKEVVCRFLATYLQQRGNLHPSRLDNQVRGFLTKMRLPQYTQDYPKADYEARIVELLGI